MKTVLHKSTDRGQADHGWLKSHHSFSFASWYDPQRMRFGLLRVLNDDLVAPGRGFGAHPHNNMEIISIPILGSLRHQDSMGNGSVIRENDVQIMSAGSGIQHSEYNASDKEPVNFFQIWIFPKEKDIKPRYGQKKFPPETRKNVLLPVISPDKNNAETLWINQDAWFALGSFEKGRAIDYRVHTNNQGVYVFVIKGKVNIEDQLLMTRDGMGISETEKINIEAAEDSEILVMEVPMD